MGAAGGRVKGGAGTALALGASGSSFIGGERRRNVRRSAVLLALAAATSPLPVAAQEALVLSGGGARGLAHAGVFQGLEELGYDPDIVVGSSMGAVMGALFAAGYTSEEIRERILDIDWDDVFTPTPLVVGPDRGVRYPMLNLDLDVTRLRVSRGLIAQWRINRALAALLFDANARARGDFDRLTRRYRAVATDLETGEEVVLAEGDLARAARASMAVPAVFAPVYWGDRILVDGGIVNNLPTSVAREIGATRVIAADVARPPETIPSLTPLAVLGRSLDLLQENTQHDPLPPDELILPRLDPLLTGASFPSDPVPMFELGLEAVRRGLDRAAPPVDSDTLAGGAPPDSLYDLLLEAPDSSLAALARTMFRGIAPGSYDPSAVLAAADRLYTTGLFEAVWPRVVENPDTGQAAPALLVRLEAPPQLSLSIAGGYDNDRGGRAWLALERYGHVGRLPAIYSGSLSQDGVDRWVSLGARVYPLNRPALAWSLGAHARERDVRHFENDALRRTDVVRVGGWAGIERPHILRDRAAALVFRSEWIHEEEGREGLASGPLLRFTSANPEVLVIGTPLLVEVDVRWGTFNYARYAAAASRTFDLGGVLVAGVADLRMATAGAPADMLPSLGDHDAVPGLQWGEERGRTRVVLGVDAAYPLGSLHLRLRARTGTVSERSTLGGGRGVSGAELGLVWLNPIAAMEWGLGVNDRGDRRFDLSIGRHF